MNNKSAKIFVIIIILGSVLFFSPKINTTTAYIEETHIITYTEYIEFNSGTIHADELLWFYYFQNNSDIELEVWMLSHAEYLNYEQTGSCTYYSVYTGSGNFSDYVSLGFPDTIHILIFNIDVPQRTTEIRLLYERDVIYPNDGGSGDDVYDSFAGALYLEEENYNSSGRLFLGDTGDFYKFYAEIGDHLSLKVNGLRYGNTSFTLYAPNGFTKVADFDDVTQDIDISIPVNYTGYWIMRFYKDGFDQLLSKYYFDIVVGPPVTLTTHINSIPLLTIITIGVSIVGTITIVRKNKKL